MSLSVVDVGVAPGVTQCIENDLASGYTYWLERLEPVSPSPLPSPPATSLFDEPTPADRTKRWVVFHRAAYISLREASARHVRELPGAEGHRVFSLKIGTPVTLADRNVIDTTVRDKLAQGAFVMMNDSDGREKVMGKMVKVGKRRRSGLIHCFLDTDIAVPLSEAEFDAAIAIYEASLLPPPPPVTP